MTEEMRRCSICHEIKPISDYYYSDKRKGKYFRYCKPCAIEVSQKSNRKRRGYKIKEIDYIPANALTWSYSGKEITFDPEAEWICMTDLWRAMGEPESKRPIDWIRSTDGKEYIDAVHKKVVVSKNHSYLFTEIGRNATTWAYWLIGYQYAAYLKPEFGVWCYTVVNDYLKGKSIDNPGSAAVLGKNNGINSIMIVDRSSPWNGATIPITVNKDQITFSLPNPNDLFTPENIGYVYLIQDRINPQWYKIGSTKNPKNREPVKIYGQSPYLGDRVCLIKTNDYLSLEKLLQDYFKVLQVNKEWYALRNEDLEVFEKLQSEFIQAQSFDPLVYFKPLTGAQIHMQIWDTN